MTFCQWLRLGCISMLIAGCEREPVQSVGDIRIHQPWIRAMAPHAPDAGGFVILENAGNLPDRLVLARTADAERVEIHEIRTDEGVMRMRPLRGGLMLPASAAVELKPGAQHLMLIAPHRRLVEGDTVTVTLEFARAGTADVSFAVLPMTTTGDSLHH